VTATAGKLFGPQTLANPYPTYRWLREHHPVYWADDPGGWLVSRYDDVAAGLRLPALSVTARFELIRRKAQQDPRLLPVIAGTSRHMLNTDPPAHTRRRALVNRAFTPWMVQNLAPLIQGQVDRILDTAEAGGRLDIVTDLAYPVAFNVMVSLLGFPPEGGQTLKRWLAAHRPIIDQIGELSMEQLQVVADARNELTEYLGRIFRERRAQPRDDLITALVQVEQAGDRLADWELLPELYSDIMLLAGAGHETTAKQIGNGVLALLRHPDQFQNLRDDPPLLRGAVEELLRFDSSVQLTTRRALEDLELGGTTIRKGQLLWLLLGAGNRDTEQFPDPDRLDVMRKDVKPLSFGGGVHFCVGAPLARLELEIAIGTLCRRFPRLQLETDDLPREANFTLRGVTSLPVVIDG
jgi:cytochrome P450